MKITEITINLVPVQGEIAKGRQLQRNLDKKWTGESSGEINDGGLYIREINDGGLYIHEIKLIMQIQEIISTFNSADKRNL